MSRNASTMRSRVSCSDTSGLHVSSIVCARVMCREAVTEATTPNQRVRELLVNRHFSVVPQPALGAGVAGSNPAAPTNRLNQLPEIACSEPAQTRGPGKKQASVEGVTSGGKMFLRGGGVSMTAGRWNLPRTMRIPSPSAKAPLPVIAPYILRIGSFLTQT
jgi:hypothetical protein